MRARRRRASGPAPTAPRVSPRPSPPQERPVQCRRGHANSFVSNSLQGPAVINKHTNFDDTNSVRQVIIGSNSHSAKAPQPTHVLGRQCLACNIREHKQCKLLSYFPAPQQLCGTRSCGKRARKAHFHGRTHARMQSPRMPAAAYADLCKVAVRKQRDIWGFFSAAQLLCAARGCGRRARKRHAGASTLQHPPRRAAPAARSKE